MPQKTKHSANPFFNLFSLMTIGTLFLLLFARLDKAAAAEMIVELDRSTGALQNDDDMARNSYANLGAYIKDCPMIQNVELVESKAYRAKFRKPEIETIYTSQLGFEIKIPTPSAKFARRIKKTPVFYSGDASVEQKKADTEMLRAVLPAVGNHQSIGRALANPNVRFLISYDKSLPDGAGGGFSHKSMTICLVAKNVCTDAAIMLAFLRNEFASLNVAIENDGRLGYYSHELPRSSPFLFYKDNSGAERRNTGPKLKGSDQVSLVKSVTNRFNDFMKTEATYTGMSEGRLQKSASYEALESMLVSFIPHPEPHVMTKGTGDWILIPENKQVDDIYDVYAHVTSGGQNMLIHIVPDSYKNVGRNKVMANIFEADPRTSHGKLKELYRTLDRYEHMALKGGHPAYAKKPWLEQQHEFYSFLEELPHELLDHLFPEYCDYLTRYTRLDQDKDNRSYCAP